MGNNTARSKRSEDDGDVIVHRRNSSKVLPIPADDTKHLHHLPGFIPSATNSRRSTPHNPETEESTRDVTMNSPLKTVFCNTPVWPHFLPPVDEFFVKEEATEEKNEVQTKKVIADSPLASPNLQAHIREIRSIVSMDSDLVDDVRESRSRGKSSGQVSKSAVERRSSDQDVLPSMPQRAAVSERILSVHMQEVLERPRAPQMPPANRRRSSLRSGIYSNRIHTSNSNNNNLRDNKGQSKKDEDDWNYHTPTIEGFDINKFKEVNGQQQTMTKEHNHDFGSPVQRKPVGDIDIDSPPNRKPLVNGFFKPRSNINSAPVNPLSYDITEEELIASIEKEFDI